MRKVNFPNCCTASVLCDFGATRLSAGIEKAIPKKAVKLWVRNQLRILDGTHLAVVITNDQQKMANRVLEELGFEHSDWMEKNTHSESMIRLWWKAPKDR